VLKADSVYLVGSMTETIGKWRQNGFVNAQGLEVAHANYFRELDWLVGYLRRLGVDVQFWQVARAENEEADRLANEALDFHR
jgi:ribonuclease HI